MFSILKTAFKLFVTQFYELNLSFFLFWFILLFGIISPESIIPYHLMLIKSEVSSYPVLAGVMAVWLIYNTKCVRFIEQIIMKYHNSFFHILQSMSKRDVITIFIICHILVFMPVSLYAFIVIGMALKQSAFLVSLFILLFLGMVTFLSAYRLRVILLKPVDTQKNSLYSKLLKNKRIIDYKFYLVHFILMEKKLDLLALKIFSSVSFYLFFVELKENFDTGWFNFTLLLIGFCHSLFMFGVHRFMEERLTFIKNLPVSLFKIISIFFIPICLVFIPELLIMLVNGQSVISVENIIISYFILVAQLMFFTSILYFKNIPLKEYVKCMFVIVLLYVFLYNAISNKLLIILVESALCYLIFKVKYLKYEHVVYNSQ